MNWIRLEKTGYRNKETICVNLDNVTHVHRDHDPAKDEDGNNIPGICLATVSGGGIRVNHPDDLTRLKSQLDLLCPEPRQNRLVDAVQAVLERCEGRLFDTDQASGQTFHELLRAALEAETLPF